MIPNKLQLHNFISYKNPKSLDFKSFNIACLAGENGVGKSSILEAITWVLWGQTRAGSDDDLIHLGETEMWVEFTFQADKNIYKIIRKRTSKKRGITELYLFSYSSKTNGFYTISEDKIADTQRKIDNILKIPYHIFINSAYLKQGKADEFTSKTPTARKEILAQILDLKTYDDLCQLAKEKNRFIKSKIELLVPQIEGGQNSHPQF